MTPESRVTYEFNGFSFDAHGMRIYYRGTAVDLPPKSLEVLRYLIEHHERVVSREELMEGLWQQNYVEESNLNVAVSRLRKALSAHDENGIYIQTLPRIGYRFVAEASESRINANEGAYPAYSPLETGQVGSGQVSRRPASKYFGTGLAIAIAMVTVASVAVFGLKSWGAYAQQNKNVTPSAAFLRGQEVLEKRLPCESLPHFREATVEEPDHARAFASLAAAQAMCGVLDGIDANIDRALVLDPDLAEAHATRGFVKMFRDWDWDEAETSLERSVALDPGSAVAHHWLGVYFSIRGRHGEAIGEITRAIDINPASPLYHADLCQVSYFARGFDAAVAACKRSLELDPNFFLPLGYLTNIYLLTGNEDKAKFYLMQDLAMANTEGTGARQILEQRGIKAYFRSELDLRIKLAERNDQFYIGELYLGLGDYENALKWYERAVETGEKPRPFWLAYLGADPRYDPLHGNSRYATILRKMNLTK